MEEKISILLEKRKQKELIQIVIEEIRKIIDLNNSVISELEENNVVNSKLRYLEEKKQCYGKEIKNLNIIEKKIVIGTFVLSLIIIMLVKIVGGYPITGLVGIFSALNMLPRVVSKSVIKNKVQEIQNKIVDIDGKIDIIKEEEKTKEKDSSKLKKAKITRMLLNEKLQDQEELLNLIDIEIANLEGNRQAIKYASEKEFEQEQQSNFQTQLKEEKTKVLGRRSK